MANIIMAIATSNHTFSDHYTLVGAIPFITMTSLGL